MSITRRCDKCGKKMKDHEVKRLKKTLGGISVEIIVAVDDVWNAGDVCWTCIEYVVEKGDRM